MQEDSIMVTGTEYLKVYGKNEAGMKPDLEGTWVLESMNGNTVIETSKVNLPAQAKSADGKPFNGAAITDKMTGSTEIRRDSVVKKTKNGTETSTTVYLINTDAQGNKITPPQGSNYHIPEKPKLSFYGMNETFSGFTGCNKIAGRYSMSGANRISFDQANASTKMVCIGDYDESIFLETLHKVNGYKSINGQLQLLDGQNILMTFSKK